MKSFTPPLAWLLVLLLIAAGMTQAAVRTSTSYSVPAETVSAGGTRSTSAAYRSEGSIGGVGLTTATGGGVYTVTQGFIGQTQGTAGPEIGVEQAGNPLASGVGGIGFGNFNVNATSPAKTFIIKNTGTAPLTIVTVSLNGTNAGDFTLNTTGMLTTVAAGGQTNFSVTFKPTDASARTAGILIASDDADEPTFQIALTGTGVITQQLTFLEQPISAFAFAGSTVDLDASASGTNPISYQWRKGAANINGATQASLSLANLKATDAAKYTVKATNPTESKTSAEAFVSVVTRAPAQVTVNEGVSLTLNATVTPPAGVIVSYLWEYDGLLLTNGDRQGRVSGANSKSLKISSAREEDMGAYACRLSMTAPEGVVVGTTDETQVIVILKPVLDPFVPDDTYVAEDVSLTITAANSPTKFTATGLPTGLKFNTTTGAITGKPTTPKFNKGVPVPYIVKFTAANSAGTSVLALTANWTILPLEPEVVGTFNGLVARHTVLNGLAGATNGLGGTVKITTTLGGSVSGTLKLGTQSLPLTGILTTPPGGGAPSATFSIKRTGTLPPFTMAFDMDLTTETCAGTVALGADSTDFSAVRLKWVGTAKPPVNRTGLFNSALSPEIPNSDPVAVPEGPGYLILTVSATGSITLGGKLGDSIGITGSTSLGPDGQVPLHLLLYGNTGSVQGWSTIADDADGAVDGLLDWYKMPQAAKVVTRSYKDGFPLHNLAVSGAKYVKPGVNTIVLGIPSAPVPNAQISFNLGGLDSQVTTDFIITTANVTKMPMSNPNAVTVTLTPANGLFTGSFTIPGSASRNVTFYGAIIPNLTQGLGQFQLPESSAATSPVWSGSVQLQPK